MIHVKMWRQMEGKNINDATILLKVKNLLTVAVY